MESIHDQAAQLGVQQPVIERYEYQEGNVTVSALTPESDQAWSTYLRDITMARLALNSIE